jgi:hypothetical protein
MGNVDTVSISLDDCLALVIRPEPFSLRVRQMDMSKLMNSPLPASHGHDVVNAAEEAPYAVASEGDQGEDGAVGKEGPACAAAGRPGGTPPARHALLRCAARPRLQSRPRVVAAGDLVLGVGHADRTSAGCEKAGQHEGPPDMASQACRGPRERPELVDISSFAKDRVRVQY